MRIYFIPIRFESTKPWGFFGEVAPSRRTRWVESQIRNMRLIPGVKIRTGEWKC